MLNLVEVTHTQQSAKVFVTTHGIGNIYGFDFGKWFDLSDYSDKGGFISAATEYAKNVLGDSKPELCFADYEGFNIPDSLLSNVNGVVWFLLALDADDCAMFNSWIEIMGIDPNTSLKEQLALAKKHYKGYFDSAFDLGADYVNNTSIEDKLIYDNIDLNKLGEHIESLLLEFDGHYFYS